VAPGVAAKPLPEGASRKRRAAASGWPAHKPARMLRRRPGRFWRSQSQRDSRAVSATVMRMKRRSPISPAPALTFARPFEWRAESLLAVTRGRDTGSGDGLRPAREMDPRGRVGAAVRRAIDDQAVWDHDEDMRATRS